MVLFVVVPVSRSNLLLIDEWPKIVDKEVDTNCVYLDFTRAIDMVQHQPLLIKLEKIMAMIRRPLDCLDSDTLSLSLRAS